MKKRPDDDAGFDLYGGLDPADQPRYSYVEAARATNVPASTVAAWTRGMRYTRRGKAPGYFLSVIERPDPKVARLSFNNLLEVNVLRALREVHEVRMPAVRDAIDRAKADHGIKRLLIDPHLKTSGGQLFLDYYFQLVELTKTQQLALQEILRESLQRIRADKSRVECFFPLPRSPRSPQGARPILVSPYVAFGSPIIERRGVTTSAIRSRVDVGEEKEAIMADYGLNEEEFDEAIRYEAAA